MKYLFRWPTIIMVVFLWAAIAADAHGSLYYVAVNGSDLNVGSKKAPFATIKHAIKRARGGTSEEHDTIIVTAGTYSTGPIHLIHDNQRILFNEGVKVIARSNKGYGKTQGPFSSPSACLIKATGRSNISIIGYKTILTMRKSEYKNLPGEWRACFTFIKCKNIHLEGLTIKDSGGDGIDITSCLNVKIKNIICDNNSRNAISVISVNGLLIKNCLLKNTKGRHPGCGIDFEPNNNNQELKNILISKTTIMGMQFMFNPDVFGQTVSAVMFRT